MEITLHCADGMEAIHRQLSEALHFPSYYGYNLDALHDCLTAVSFDVFIYLLECEQLPQLQRVLLDCVEENPYIHLK